MAHKKGMGSTKNGRDSESKRLGVKRADGQAVLAGNILLRITKENKKKTVDFSRIICYNVVVSAWNRLKKGFTYLQ